MDLSAAKEIISALVICVLLFCVSRCTDNSFQREHEKEMGEPCVCDVDKTDPVVKDKTVFLQWMPEDFVVYDEEIAGKETE
jgi:hypothetical protein